MPEKTTITISLEDAVDEHGERHKVIKVQADDQEGGKAVGRKRGSVYFTADKTVKGIWAAAVKGASPFRGSRKGFSGIGDDEEGEDIAKGLKAGAEFCYVVFCQAEEDSAEILFLDPIIVIRDSSLPLNGFDDDETTD